MNINLVLEKTSPIAEDSSFGQFILNLPIADRWASIPIADRGALAMRVMLIARQDGFAVSLTEAVTALEAVHG